MRTTVLALSCAAALALTPATPQPRARTAVSLASGAVMVPERSATAAPSESEIIWFEVDSIPDEPTLSCYLPEGSTRWLCALDADFKFHPDDGY